MTVQNPQPSTWQAKMKAIVAFVVLLVGNLVVNYVHTGNVLPVNETGGLDLATLLTNLGVTFGGTGLVYGIPAPGYVGPPPRA